MSDGDGDGEPADPDPDPDHEPERDHGGRPCPHCERPLFKRHCKYVCPQHGVVYDCADTFW
ncbi:hypothetical protein SAMN05444422_11824 [Halobiforma haloterrestris]|uniref:Small CPxCG-related zinc finger protein n=1 Tax=Natronobacterium haloterrestre TaxID=148448 RepID=A0A1I1LKN4_NATHA|nr:HVO_2523 family zinc finger protein [Halobiforma haloterrestris]SFC73591.1 hypothetical protein SAMN05444422_11824 [Halobiforma haloterrestris]